MQQPRAVQSSPPPGARGTQITWRGGPKPRVACWQRHRGCERAMAGRPYVSYSTLPLFPLRHVCAGTSAMSNMLRLESRRPGRAREPIFQTLDARRNTVKHHGCLTLSTYCNLRSRITSDPTPSAHCRLTATRRSGQCRRFAKSACSLHTSCSHGCWGHVCKTHTVP
jgi:hypothetical protein